MSDDLAHLLCAATNPVTGIPHIAQDGGCPLHVALAEAVRPHLQRHDIAQGAADERARITWWLRATATGPAAVTTGQDVLEALVELADVIEQHPERFANAPTTAGEPYLGAVDPARCAACLAYPAVPCAQHR